MPTYQLKPGQDDFDVVDGPAAGKTFRRGRTYDKIPANEKHRFEPVKQAKRPVAPPAAKPEKATPATDKKTMEKEK